jgi:hypothetical protein
LGQTQNKDKPEKFWRRPYSTEVKVIDFGGATYENERHTLIINTR